MSHPIEAKNWVDRFVEFVSPTRAAERYRARAAISVARSMPAASYRGSVATRSANAWGSSVSFRGGSTRDRRDLAEMRDRARGAYRDNVIAGSLLNTETDNVVAEGFTLQMQTEDEAFNDEVETKFYRWLEKADVSGYATASDLFRMSWREPRKDGDGGFVLLTRGGYPYLQYIPGDLIRNPYKGFDFRTMFDGVECDASGRAQRFWIRDVDEAGKDTVSPIDARDFVYIAHRTDPLDARGCTVFSPVFPHLDQFDTYVDSVTKTAIMACIFGLIEKRNKPGDVLKQMAMEDNAGGVKQKAVTLDRDGMLKVMGTDETMFQVQAQQPMTQTPDFMRALFRVICLAFQMPLEIGQKDLSQVNFSGGQLGMKDYERACRIKQDWLKSKCWNRIVFWWLSIERRRQELGFPDAFKSKFPAEYGVYELHAREWLLRDRLSEAKADLMEFAVGVGNPKRACAYRSIDYKENLRQRKEAWDDNKEAGLPNVLPTESRDAIDPTASPAAAPAGPDPALEKIKAEADAYGVAVRAGAITPQTPDEDAFREKLSLPAMSSDAKRAWMDDKGVRRPITITPSGGKPAPVGGQPAPDPNSEDSQQ